MSWRAIATTLGLDRPAEDAIDVSYRRKRHQWTERSCMDGPLSARTFSSFRQADQVRSCIRPVCAVHGPLALREYEVGLQDHLCARGAMTFAECPDPVSDRFAVTSKLPLRSWTRVTRSTNSIRGVDAQSIHTLFIGQPCDSPPRGRLLVWLKQRALPCRHAGADDSSRP